MSTMNSDFRRACALHRLELEGLECPTGHLAERWLVVDVRLRRVLAIADKKNVILGPRLADIGELVGGRSERFAAAP